MGYAAAVFFLSVASGQGDISVLLNGEAIDFGSKGKPVIAHRRVLVPLRGVFEKLGAKVEFDADQLKITATKANVKIELWVGSRHAIVNGEEKLFDTALSIREGRAMVPLRFLAETLDGASVGWRPKTRTVVIKTAK